LLNCIQKCSTLCTENCERLGRNLSQFTHNLFDYGFNAV